MKHNHLTTTVLAFALLLVLPGCLCIYEDEIGLADWYQPHIGRINTAFFLPPRQLVVATDSAVLAALNVKSGEITWRQVLPKGTNIDKLHHNDQNILIVSGRRVSVWSIADEGNLRWEEEVEGDVIDAKLSDNLVSIATTTGITLRSITTGASVHSTPPLTPTAIQPLSSSLYAISTQEGSLQINTVGLQSPYTLASSTASLSAVPVKGVAPLITAEGCAVLLGGSSGKFVVLAHQLKSSSKSALSYTLDSHITQASLQLVGNDSFTVRTPTEQLLFRPKSDAEFPFHVAQKLPIGTTFAAGGSQSIYSTSTPSSTIHFTNKTGTYHHALASPAHFLSLLTPSPYLLVVSNDWRASVFSLNTLLSSSASISPAASPFLPLWEREEALAAVVKTEMIELPPDVTDLNDLVREFEGESNSIASRVLAQLEHVTHLIMNIGDTLRGLVVLASSTVIGHRDLTHKELITKDRFGFRKVIVALTASGKVLGLSTDHGQVIWGTNVQSTGFSTDSFVYVTRTSAAYPPEIVVGDATGLYKLNPITGQLVSSTPSPKLLQVVPLPFLYTQTGTASQLPNTHILMLVHPPSSSSSTTLSVSLFPDTTETAEVFRKNHDKVHFFIINKSASTITGYAFPDKENPMRASVAWNVTFGQGHESIEGLTAPHPHDKVYHPAAVLGDRNILPKYINRNLIGIATVATSTGASVLHVYLVDTVTGSIVFHTQHADCGGLQNKVALVLMENSLVYTYWNTKTHKHQMSVIDMYTKEVDWKNTHFSSYTAPLPATLMQSYILPTPVSLLAHTSSARGITAKHLLMGLASDSVVSLDKRWADARRPLPQAVTAADKEENLIPYFPRLHFPPPTYVTYNQTVHRLSKIVTSGSSLESTTLVLAVGLDLFFTRISPAEAYDILTSDFNYPALILTITLLCVATFITSSMSRKKDTLRAWK